jgi:hypothetical protein
MAGIDYSIPGQIKGIQLESPMNAMAQAMQLRGLQEASQMNALKTQEYARKAREDQELAAQQNELAKIHSSDIKIGSPEYFNLVAAKAPRLLESVQERALKRSELDEKIEERRFKNFGRKFDLYKSFVPTINSIDGVTQYVSAAYQDPDLAPILNQIRPYAEALNANQDEFNRDPESWKLNASGVSPEKIIEIARNRAEETRKQTEFEQKQGDRTAPKPEKFELGGKIVTRDMNPNSSTYLQTISTDEKTAAPAALTESNVARLERERAELYAKDPDDPRIKNYDAAIQKETGGTPPEIVREYEYAIRNKQFKGTLLQFKEAFARAGRPLSITQAAPTVTMVLDPADPTRMLSIDAKTYRGGSLGSPGVIGIAGKEPMGAKKQESKEIAQSNAETTIARLRQSYDQLDKLGGITSTQNRAGTNIMAGLSSSGLGQATGRLLGTEAQSERNKIAQARPLLMTTIMQAMGLSAKQLDSNAELKLWLSSATDPTLDLEANREALNNLETMLTGKGKAKPGAPNAKPAPPPPSGFVPDKK